MGVTPFQQKVIDDLKRTRAEVKPDMVVQLKDLRERFIFQGGSEFALRLADEISKLRRDSEELRAAMRAAALDVDRFTAGHRRYEKLRRLNVPQFQEIFKRNLKGNKPFDELVDELP